MSKVVRRDRKGMFSCRNVINVTEKVAFGLGLEECKESL
jgi:hypothetical protein